MALPYGIPVGSATPPLPLGPAFSGSPVPRPPLAPLVSASACTRHGLQCGGSLLGFPCLTPLVPRHRRCLSRLPLGRARGPVRGQRSPGLRAGGWCRLARPRGAPSRGTLPVRSCPAGKLPSTPRAIPLSLPLPVPKGLLRQQDLVCLVQPDPGLRLRAAGLRSRWATPPAAASAPTALRPAAAWRLTGVPRRSDVAQHAPRRGALGASHKLRGVAVHPALAARHHLLLYRHPGRAKSLLLGRPTARPRLS